MGTKDIKMLLHFQITIEAVTVSGFLGDIALDDIDMTLTPCPPASKFDHNFFCSDIDYFCIYTGTQHCS